MHFTREPHAACAPFARGRRGFVLAEGAGMLVLERLDRGRARGAVVYALVAGAAVVYDAQHVINPEATGQAWARAMRLALADAGLDAAAVDAISAHGTATPQGDVAEARAIAAVLGPRAAAVPVSATKSMHGHAFGAASDRDALAVAAMDAGVVLPTINLAEPDPACPLDHVVERARPHAARVLIKNGFGAGGVATSLVLTRRADAPRVAADPTPPRDEFAF
jgi:3-oxoacyl-(acyl-carrier-protein) synthase